VKPVIESLVMKRALLLLGALLVANAPAQQPDDFAPSGVIYGTVVDQNGQPASGIGLRAHPLGGGFGTMLPTTKTDIPGKYRFENLSSRGAYTVHADDEKAGYSEYATGLVREIPTGPGVYGGIAQIILSPQQSKAEFNFRLPPKAGFLHIHLTNHRTGAPIAILDIKVTSQDEPDRFNFSEGCLSDRAILLPPEKDLRVHISSAGFLEWDESVGAGKLIRMASGSSLDLDAQLEPSST
jgi:hypothetical protein